MELYHFTCLEWWEKITADGVIKASADSNLMRGCETLDECLAQFREDTSNPIFLPNGQYAYNHISTADEPKVVWLTDNPDNSPNLLKWAANNSQLFNKRRVRITVDVPMHEAKKWSKWYERMGGSQVWREPFIESGGDWKSWFICEREIPQSEWVEVRDLDTNVVLWRRPDLTQPVTKHDVERAVSMAHMLNADKAQIVIMNDRSMVAFAEYTKEVHGLVSIPHNINEDFFFVFQHPVNNIFKNKNLTMLLAIGYKFRPIDENGELRCDVTIVGTENQDELCNQRLESVFTYQSNGELVLRANGDYHSAPHMNFYVHLRRFLSTTYVDTERRNSPKKIQLPGKHPRRIPESNIQVVVMRRPERMGPSSRGTGEGRKLDHQVQVPGHYRNQWYPSSKSHRRIFVPDYVKGPEGEDGLQGKIRVIKGVR